MDTSNETLRVIGFLQVHKNELGPAIELVTEYQRLLGAAGIELNSEQEARLWEATVPQGPDQP